MKIEIDEITTIEDTNDNLIKNKDGVTCNCGNPKLSMTCHIDGVDFYSFQYMCQCGNQVTVTNKRVKEDNWNYESEE